jgi:hypothetical protein
MTQSKRRRFEHLWRLRSCAASTAVAEGMLGAASAYAQASNAVGLAIRALKQQFGAL